VIFLYARIHGDRTRVQGVLPNSIELVAWWDDSWKEVEGVSKNPNAIYGKPGAEACFTVSPNMLDKAIKFAEIALKVRGERHSTISLPTQPGGPKRDGENDSIGHVDAIESVNEKNTIVNDLTDIFECPNLDLTTKKTLIDARLGQGAFRARVLQTWDNCCSVTGSALLHVIRASHIKPWHKSSNQERLDPENGLPLVANLDALFDAGLISFDSSGALLVSPRVSATEIRILGITQRSLRKKPTPKMAVYLAEHRVKHGFHS
jgi:hypothetical protein